MIKLPKKSAGITFLYDGKYLLTCKETGQEYNGVMGLAWYHENGEQAFRSINGEITFLEPVESEPDFGVEILSRKDKETLKLCAQKALACRNFLAPYIAELDPQLGRNPAGVGQIINFAMTDYNKPKA